MTSISWFDDTVTVHVGKDEHAEHVVSAHLDPRPGLVAGAHRPQQPLEGDIVDAIGQCGAQRRLVGVTQVDPARVVRHRRHATCLGPGPTRMPSARAARAVDGVRLPVARSVHDAGLHARSLMSDERVEHVALVGVPLPVVAREMQDLIDMAIAEQ